MRKQDLARAAEVAVISIKFLYYKHDSLAAKVRLFCLFAHSVSLYVWTPVSMRET